MTASSEANRKEATPNKAKPTTPSKSLEELFPAAEVLRPDQPGIGFIIGTDKPQR